MKRDELEKFDATSNADRSAGIESRYAYDADEVEAAIAELKAENDRLEKLCQCYRHDCDNIAIREDNLIKEHRSTKRALWLARAKRAKIESQHWIVIWRCDYTTSRFFINKSRYKHTSKVDRMRYPWEWRDIWIEVEKRCIKKAEAYK